MLDENYREANREAWNEAADIHRKGRGIDYAEAFKDPSFTVLDDIFIDIIKPLLPPSPMVAQLACNDGRELFSVINTFGGRGFGYDISDEFIAEAMRTKEATGLDCNFVRADLFDIDPEEQPRFDLIFFTAGALGWYHDLRPVFKTVSNLLSQGGYLVVYEIHPATHMLGYPGEDEYDPDHPLLAVHSYFRKEPWVDNDGVDYIGQTTYESKPFTSFTYKVSDLINAVIKSELDILEFNEYPSDVTPFREDIEKGGLFPLSYSLAARKG